MVAQLLKEHGGQGKGKGKGEGRVLSSSHLQAKPERLAMLSKSLASSTSSDMLWKKAKAVAGSAGSQAANHGVRQERKRVASVKALHSVSAYITLHVDAGFLLPPGDLRGQLSTPAYYVVAHAEGARSHSDIVGSLDELGPITLEITDISSVINLELRLAVGETELDAILLGHASIPLRAVLAASPQLPRSTEFWLATLPPDACSHSPVNVSLRPLQTLLDAPPATGSAGNLTAVVHVSMSWEFTSWFRPFASFTSDRWAFPERPLQSYAYVRANINRFEALLTKPAPLVLARDTLLWNSPLASLVFWGLHLYLSLVAPVWQIPLVVFGVVLFLSFYAAWARTRQSHDRSLFKDCDKGPGGDSDDEEEEEDEEGEGLGKGLEGGMGGLLGKLSSAGDKGLAVVLKAKSLLLKVSTGLERVNSDAERLFGLGSWSEFYTSLWMFAALGMVACALSLLLYFVETSLVWAAVVSACMILTLVRKVVVLGVGVYRAIATSGGPDANASTINASTINAKEKKKKKKEEEGGGRVELKGPQRFFVSRWLHNLFHRAPDAVESQAVDLFYELLHVSNAIVERHQ